MYRVYNSITLKQNRFMGKAKKTEEDLLELKLIGDRINKIRNKRKLTQDEVSHATNIARSHFGEIDRGETNLTALTLIQIAVVLDVSVGELFPSKRELIDIESKRKKK
jgi:transcriptional regulator with XRE-family HTH domain